MTEGRNAIPPREQRLEEAMRIIQRDTAAMIRSMRKAKETPREGVQAGLSLILLIADAALDEGKPDGPL